MNNNKTLLHILLVITFIFAGLSCISYFFVTLLQPTIQSYYSAHPEVLPGEMQTMMQQMLEVPRTYFAVSSLLYALELAGAILMWNLRASGFHCYTLARLLLLLIPLLFLGRAYIGIGDVMFALLYIAVYWMLLRQQGVFGDKKAEATDNGDEGGNADLPDSDNQ
jgi:hypothetical protein